MCVWCGMVKNVLNYFSYVFRLAFRSCSRRYFCIKLCPHPNFFFFFKFHPLKRNSFFFTPLRVIYLLANALFNVVDHSRQSPHSLFDMF